MSDTKITMPYGTGKTTTFSATVDRLKESLKQVCAISVKQCSTCKWYIYFLGAYSCCNGDSGYRADFTGSDFVCDKWEERENA